MSELIQIEKSKTELTIARDMLLSKIDIFLKNNICEECKENPEGVIIYPNGNKYCVHRIKEANRKFKQPYTDLAYAFNDIEKD